MTEEMTIDETDLKEHIKLSKMSKGYNWEIKIFHKIECLLPSDIARLKALDLEMRENWGAE